MPSREKDFLSKQVALQSSLVAASAEFSVKLAEALKRGDMKEFDELRERSENLNAFREALTSSNYLKGKN